MPTRAGPGRMAASMLASTIVHVVSIALFVRLAGPPAAPVVPLDAVVVIPVSLVRLGGAGPAPVPAPEPAVVETAGAPPPPRPVAAVEIPKKRAPSPVVAAPTRDVSAAMTAAVARATPPLSPSARSTGLGDGPARGETAGDGAGDDGSGGARPAYGSNPLPPYPLIARRLGIEGRVLLEVVVRPDGRTASVRVRTSSGNGALDRAALETVRTRWRFVPARAAGVPVESTVTVPIRFRLDRS